MIIAELLGVDPERKDQFKHWSDNVVLQIGASQEDAERMDEELEGFREYFEATVEERRRQPRGDLISVLVQAEAQQQALTSDEVMGFIGLLLIAGNETTTNLLGNAVLALLAHPEQLARVLDDASLIPNLVEEALRYDAPVQFLFRVATQEVELAGTALPKGAAVLPLFGSANRDERRFTNAGRFDVTRDAQGHVAFGHGIHFCLGAPLARLEARIALEALLFGFRDLALKEDRVERIDSFFLRGPKRLPLTFEPVPARVTA
jgi:cytochrome P450